MLLVLKLSDKNRIQSPEIDPSVYKKLIYDPHDISNQCGEGTLFNK